MLCDHCGKNEATFHCTVQTGSVKKESHLCNQCATISELSSISMQELEELEKFAQDTITLSHWMSDILTPQPKVVKKEKTCSVCGLKERDFKKTGRFGCEDCYKHFSAYLPNMLQQLHGKAEHIGIRPEDEIKEEDPLHRLEQALREAVLKEDFEKAAELRDAIKALREKEGD